jgi:hypothetical protein
MAAYIPELTNISFSAISTHLNLFSESLGLPSTSANSPLLGVSPELYYFVIEASRLSLAMPLNDSDFAAASSLKAKILQWKDIYGLEQQLSLLLLHIPIFCEVLLCMWLLFIYSLPR